MKQSRFIHALIAGHGGLDPSTGKYTTEPNKMHPFSDGLTMYEGVENRHIKDTIIGLSDWESGLNVIDLVPDWEDISLKTRVDRIHQAKTEAAKYGKQLLVWELHLNAFNSKASGREIYTTRGDNFSDKMAQEWIEVIDSLDDDQKARYDFADGDGDKEKDFYVIKNSPAFAVLIEFYFFDNRQEVDRFATAKGRALLATSVIKAMKNINNKYS